MKDNARKQIEIGEGKEGDEDQELKNKFTTHLMIIFQKSLFSKNQSLCRRLNFQWLCTVTG